MRVLVLVLVALLAEPVATATTFSVMAGDNFWAPTPTSILIGDTVDFAVAPGARNPHTYLGPGGGCGLPCSRTFSGVADVAYQCGVHGSLMSGLVRVLAGHGPDLVANAPVSTSTNPRAATVVVTVTNRGDAPSTASAVRLEYVGTDGARHDVGTRTLGALAAGASATVPFDWGDGHLRTGSFQVVATADPAGTVAESSEDNNEAATTVTFVSGSLPRQQV